MRGKLNFDYLGFLSKTIILKYSQRFVFLILAVFAIRDVSFSHVIILFNNSLTLDQIDYEEIKIYNKILEL